MKRKMIKPLLAATLSIAMLGGCTTEPGLVESSNSNATGGAVLGAMAGALIGANSGSHSGRNALLGAAIGAAAGGAIGYSIDNQANEIARALGTGVNNDPLAALDPNNDLIVSKTNTYVKIMFRDRMMFSSGSANLQSRAKSKVKKVGQLLANYPQTVVGVAGFTDNQGSYSYNQGLSQRRANTVANILAVNGYPTTRGCSFDKAIAPNNSATNRGLNRRVEVYLYSDKNKMSDPCR